MLNRRTLLATMLASTALAVRPNPAALAQDGGERLVITDARGDYGLLAPYTHATNGPGYLYTSYVFDTLLDQDVEGTIVPGLAKSWQVSTDHRTYDLVLDPSARWHDGTAVTAADAAFTFSCMQAHPHPFVSLETVETAEAVADDRIRITLARPDSSFLTNVLATMMVLPRHIYESQPEPARFGDAAAATGSGPYRLARYDKAQGRYVLERNPDYHRGTPRFAQVAIVRMTPEAAIQAMRAGEADIISDLPYELVPQARAAGITVLTVASNHPERLVFNHRGLFASRALRHGLAHSIDRKALAEIAYPDAAFPASVGYFQPGSPWHSGAEVADYAYDRQRADALFESAGWSRDTDGRWTVDGRPLELRLITDGRYRRSATVLAEQIEASGLSVDLRLLEVAALQQQAQAEDFDLMLRATSTIGDPGAILSRVLGKSWTSDRFPDEDGRMRALIEAQAAAMDHGQRLEFLHRFEALYAEELPSLMLVNALWATAHNDRVTPAFLPDGIASGIPMALHKSMFFR